MDETIRIAELYASIRRYSGLLGNFAPIILDMDPRDVEQLMKDIEMYQETVPKDIQERMYIAPVYMDALKSECKRRLSKIVIETKH